MTDNLLWHVFGSAVYVGLALLVAVLLLSFYDHTLHTLRQRLNLAAVVGACGFFFTFFLEALGNGKGY